MCYGVLVMFHLSLKVFKLARSLTRFDKLRLIVLTSVVGLCFSPIVLAATAIEYGLIATQIAFIALFINNGAGTGAVAVFNLNAIDYTTAPVCVENQTCNLTYSLNLDLGLAMYASQPDGISFALGGSYSGVTLTPGDDNRVVGLSATAPGTYQVIATDTAVTPATTTILNITFTSPVKANAGANQTVHVGTPAMLDGSNSTSTQGGAINYAWSFDSKPAGSNATFSSANAVSTTFTPDVLGNYVIRLTVTAAGYTDSSTVLISTSNSAPVANAGNQQSVHPGTPVTLDGTQSYDADGDSITYHWVLSPPAGSTATLNDQTLPNPTFNVDILGTYTATLIVNDGYADSNASTVIISTSNSAPIANAGSSSSVTVGTPVTLNGSESSDADNDTLTYTWVLISAPVGSNATLSDPNSPSPTFTPNVTGTYIAGLTVSDGYVNSTQATVQILVMAQQSTIITQLQTLQQYINGLPLTDFKPKIAKEIEVKAINAIIKEVAAGRNRLAINLLKVMSITVDGCTLGGHAKAADLIINCSSQVNVYMQIQSIISNIQLMK